MYDFGVYTGEIFEIYEKKVTKLFERINLVKFDPSTDNSISGFKQATSETASYAAEIGAFSKNAKSDFLILHLQKIKSHENLDLTPTLAKNILRKIVGKGKGISFKTLLDKFGTEGRKSDDKSGDHENLDQICEKYIHIKKELEWLMAELKTIRDRARK